MRDVLFLSHANPEDNEVTLWFALQLTLNGYPVWCDLLDVIAGQDFWTEAESALRTDAQKVIYILSHTSNKKIGPLKELSVAQKLERKNNEEGFVIALRVDDLPYDDINIELTRSKVINCYPSRTSGFAELLDALNKYGLRPNPDFSPNVVSLWWDKHVKNLGGLANGNDLYISNYYNFNPPFPNLNIYSVGRETALPLEGSVPFPWVRNGSTLISFAKPKTVQDLFKTEAVRHETSLDFDTFNSNISSRTLPDRPLRKIAISQLLRLTWEKLVSDNGVNVNGELTSPKQAYFKQSQTNKDRLVSRDGHNPSRVSVIGYKSLYRGPDKPKKIRYWHFAYQARTSFTFGPGIFIKPQILFSDDGENIWQDYKKMHKARRSQAAAWWNPFWRDHIAAFIDWLSRGKSSIAIDVGGNSPVTLSAVPLSGNLNTTYDDALANQLSDVFGEDTPDDVEEDEGDL